MKFIDINRKFTAAVSSYMAQGYYINAASMSGSQGEIAHIDLTDGKQMCCFICNLRWSKSLSVK